MKALQKVAVADQSLRKERQREALRHLRASVSGAGPRGRGGGGAAARDDGASRHRHGQAPDHRLPPRSHRETRLGGRT